MEWFGGAHPTPAPDARLRGHVDDLDPLSEPGTSKKSLKVSHLGVSKNMEKPTKSSKKNRVFHYKPSIFGRSLFLETSISYIEASCPISQAINSHVRPQAPRLRARRFVIHKLHNIPEVWKGTCQSTQDSMFSQIIIGIKMNLDKFRQIHLHQFTEYSTKKNPTWFSSFWTSESDPAFSSRHIHPTFRHLLRERSWI